MSIIVDNGNGIDVKQLTQDYLTYTNPHFCVDKNDDIYIIYHSYSGWQLDIYYNNGGFSSIDFSRYLPSESSSESTEFIDMQLDKNGDLLLLMAQNVGEYECRETQFVVGAVINGEYVEYERLSLPEIYSSIPYNTEPPEAVYPYFIGDDEEFRWFLPQEFWDCYYNGYSGPIIDGVEPPSTTLFRILTYIPETREFKLEDLPDELINVFIRNYDALLCGVKSYGVNVRNSTIEVTEIDVIDETYRQYSFDVDLSSMTAMHYTMQNLNGFPYLIINGKSTDNGVEALFKINLATGENNSTFGKDGRKVTSFFRIN